VDEIDAVCYIAAGAGSNESNPIHLRCGNEFGIVRTCSESPIKRGSAELPRAIPSFTETNDGHASINFGQVRWHTVRVLMDVSDEQPNRIGAAVDGRNAAANTGHG